MCRSNGAQLHDAISLLQRFSSSGAIYKSERGDPFATDSKETKSQSRRDEIFVEKNDITNASSVGAQPNLRCHPPTKICSDGQCRTGQTKSKNTKAS